MKPELVAMLEEEDQMMWRQHHPLVLDNADPDATIICNLLSKLAEEIAIVKLAEKTLDNNIIENRRIAAQCGGYRRARNELRADLIAATEALGEEVIRTEELQDRIERLENAHTNGGGPEFLGRLVRMTWREWAGEQPNVKASWLTLWEDLSEAERDVDCRIGMAVANVCVTPELLRVEAERGKALEQVGELRRELRQLYTNLMGTEISGNEGDVQLIFDQALRRAAEMDKETADETH